MADVYPSGFPVFTGSFPSQAARKVAGVGQQSDQQVYPMSWLSVQQVDVVASTARPKQLGSQATSGLPW